MTNLKDKSFALIGVHVGGASAKQLRKVMDKEKITWRTFVDDGNAGAGPIATKWSLAATPTFYVIDHKGVIRYKWAGAPGEKVMSAALDKLIQAAEANGGSCPQAEASFVIPLTKPRVRPQPAHGPIPVLLFGATVEVRCLAGFTLDR